MRWKVGWTDDQLADHAAKGLDTERLAKVEAAIAWGGLIAPRLASVERLHNAWTDEPDMTVWTFTDEELPA